MKKTIIFVVLFAQILLLVSCTQYGRPQAGETTAKQTAPSAPLRAYSDPNYANITVPDTDIITVPHTNPVQLCIEIPSAQKYKVSESVKIRIGIGCKSKENLTGNLTVETLGNLRIKVGNELSAKQSFTYTDLHRDRYAFEPEGEFAYMEEQEFCYVSSEKGSGVLHTSICVDTDAETRLENFLAVFYASDGEYIAYSTVSVNEAEAALRS